MKKRKGDREKVRKENERGKGEQEMGKEKGRREKMQRRKVTGIGVGAVRGRLRMVTMILVVNCHQCH